MLQLRTGNIECAATGGGVLVLIVLRQRVVTGDADGVSFELICCLPPAFCFRGGFGGVGPYKMKIAMAWMFHRVENDNREFRRTRVDATGGLQGALDVAILCVRIVAVARGAGCNMFRTSHSVRPSVVVCWCESVAWSAVECGWVEQM